MDKKEFSLKVDLQNKSYTVYDLSKLEQKGIANIKRLPYSIRVLVENLLRKMDGNIVKEQDVNNIANWSKTYSEPVEIPYHPARVLMQDFTGVPAVVDIASMRDAFQTLGKDPKKINPLVPTELIIDHSIQLDYYGTVDSIDKNVEKEYQRNGERYSLLKWAQKSFNNFKVVPPNSGICHQVNLEYLSRVIITEKIDGNIVAYPDTLVGTDSHTTMINGIGVMGWGVGGIEAEAVMLGQPYFISIPEVIGVKMTGKLKEGITATDLVLTVTELLRQHKVVEKFVEFFGPGIKNLSLTDRATIANMSPEYGATMGYFPIDEKTIDYLKITNREERATLVEACAKGIGTFYSSDQEPEYTKVIDLDLSKVEPSIAGPSRPQDRLTLTTLRESFHKLLDCSHERDTDMKNISTFHDESGSTTKREEVCVPGTVREYDVIVNDKKVKIGDGSVVISAITSCTNTSNPHVLIGAGLLAKNAVKKGLKVLPHIKTSLVPGSKVVIDYLEKSNLLPYLEALGYHLAGFGCTTCIGNSGPLHPEIEKIITEKNLSVAAVLSGNRNFEARIHQNVKCNYLASPMLVVAYALAGTIDIDLSKDPLGKSPNGDSVYLKDIWPSSDEIEHLSYKNVKPDLYKNVYDIIFNGDKFWEKLDATQSTTYDWDIESSYIKNPPYFDQFSLDLNPLEDIKEARALLLLHDSVTTDHISPAGAIPESYPAGQYLLDKNIQKQDFNSYGSRRGNHEVMMRGTFGNIRIKNKLVVPKEGSFTIKFPEEKEMSVYEAAMLYKQNNTPLIVMGGKEYGTGSSRDWAAKGTTLLGVKAVIAKSFERIHRSNLIGMGVLPLIFKQGESYEKLGLDGTEVFSISGIKDMTPRKNLAVKAVKKDSTEINFEVTVRLDTVVEVEYYKHGGILPYVLRKMAL